MRTRPSNLPILIVTGASGFIGRNFLQAVKDDFYIYAFARRSQELSHSPVHENIQWIQLDISLREMVQDAMDKIIKSGGADFIIHLAGYYDFSNSDTEEYEKTNVTGTAHMLEFAQAAGIKRFIYASSLTITNFDKEGTIVDEKGSADATFPYAISKAKAEKLIRKYSRRFPCAIMRLAAIFSDWCEYGPLYIFLTTWLSKNWRSRILAGSGETAIPYLHTHDMNSFLLNIMNKTKSLPKCPVLIASPDGCTTHNALFKISTRYVYRRNIQPFYMPKWFATMGVAMRDQMGKMLGKRPFERVWMMHYIDKKLDIDSHFTREILEWRPTPRYHIRRRLLFLIENMKGNPYEWDYKNYEAIYKTDRPRPNLIIYDAMLRIEHDVIQTIKRELLTPENGKRFQVYRLLENDNLEARIKYIYQVLKTAVRTGDRLHIVHYGKDLAYKRFIEGFEKEEVINAVKGVGEIVIESLNKLEDIRALKERFTTDIGMTIQLVTDEIEDSFEQLTGFRDT